MRAIDLPFFREGTGKGLWRLLERHDNYGLSRDEKRGAWL